MAMAIEAGLRQAGGNYTARGPRGRRGVRYFQTRHLSHAPLLKYAGAAASHCDLPAGTYPGGTSKAACAQANGRVKEAKKPSFS
jgi:hypothetical protein